MSEAKLALTRFLQGPNLFASCTGALITFKLSPALASWLAAAPQDIEWQVWDDACRRLWGRGSGAAAPSGQRNSATRWVDHLLRLNDVLRLPYCIEQQAARVHALSADQLLMFVPCDDAQLGIRAAALSASLLLELRAPAQPGMAVTPPVSGDRLERWRKQLLGWHTWAETNALNVNARLVAKAAVQLGMPCYRLPGSNRLLQIGQGRHQRRLYGAFTDAISQVASQFSQDKWQSSALFAANGLPTPSTRVVSTIAEALGEAARLGWPVVLKPRSTNKGVGITTDVRDGPTLKQAFAKAAQFRTGVLLERHVPGDDHRLLVVGGRFVAAARRLPARVQGDGKRTVAQLVDALNLAREQGLAPGVYLPQVQVELDAEALRVLAASGYGAEDVPPEGTLLPLRGHANLSTGGFSEDVTPLVHPDNRALAERAARLVALSMAGVDFQTGDITRSWREVGGAILEINAGPGLLPHQPPTEHHDVPRAILDDLFPQGTNGRIPTAGVTGSVGKTTTCRMLARILQQDGHTVALASTQGIYLDEQPLRKGDLAGGVPALPMLQDRAVTAAVMEMSRGGLIKTGMGLDSVDVGAVLNIHDNHLGLDGIRSREQMARVKQLVARHARRLAVLNADDPLCLAMSEGLDPVKVCLVSESMGPRLESHLRAGGMAAFLRSDAQGLLLCLQQASSPVGEMPVADIPATWHSTFRPAMLNALFAAAMAHGLGIPFRSIEQALTGFKSDYRSNPGRMNPVAGLPFELWLSWADGPQALSELARFVSQRPSSADKSLLFYVVGNRTDSFIEASASAVANSFDRYYCCDMEEDRRGRAPGEVAALMAKVLRQAGIPDAAIVADPSSQSAVSRALREMQPGGVLVIASYHPDKVLATVRSMWPQLVLENSSQTARF